MKNTGLYDQFISRTSEFYLENRIGAGLETKLSLFFYTVFSLLHTYLSLDMTKVTFCTFPHCVGTRATVPLCTSTDQFLGKPHIIEKDVCVSKYLNLVRTNFSQLF